MTFLFAYQFLEVLQAAEDPESGKGRAHSHEEYESGPGARRPKLPALYLPTHNWRIASCPHYDRQDADTACRRNYASVAELVDKVVEVLDELSSRTQVLELTEFEANRRFTKSRLHVHFQLLTSHARRTVLRPVRVLHE